MTFYQDFSFCPQFSSFFFFWIFSLLTPSRGLFSPDTEAWSFTYTDIFDVTLHFFVHFSPVQEDAVSLSHLY